MSESILAKEQIVRAWKDEEFRNSLTEEQQAALPAAPVDFLELNDEELDAIAGGKDSGCQKGAVTCSGTGSTVINIDIDDC